MPPIIRNATRGSYADPAAIPKNIPQKIIPIIKAILVEAFLERPLEGEWPYLWLDATYIKVRRSGRIVSVAAIVVVAVNMDGRR